MGPHLLMDEQKKGFPSLVYLIRAKDEFFFREAIHIIKASLKGGHQTFNLDIYDMEDTERPFSMAHIIDTLNTISFFSTKKYVIIRNFQKIKKADLEKLKRYIADPSPHSSLFLFYNGDIKKSLSIEGMHLIDCVLKPSAISGWIKKQALDKGIKLSKEATGFLAEIYGDNASLLDNELEKLSLFGKKEIDIHDLNETIYGTKSVSPFEITGAIARGDKEKALKGFNTIRREVESLMFLGALNWQMAKLTKAPKEARLKAYDLIVDTERRLKSSNPDLPLDLLILKLLQTIKGSY